MSSSTLDPKATPSGAGGEQTPAEGAKPGRRYRRPVSRAKKAATTAETTTPTTGAQGQHVEPAPATAPTAAERPAEHATPATPTAHEVAAAQQAEQTQQTAQAAEPRSRGNGRGQRGERRGAGRKGGVQLVIPANGATESKTLDSATEAPEAYAEPRVVPVVTDASHAATHTVAEPAGGGATAAAPVETAAPQGGATSRYRFGRRPASFGGPAAAAIRPERLSSQQTPPQASLTADAEAQMTDQREAAEQSAPATELHLTPATPSTETPDLFGSRSRPFTGALRENAVTSDAVDDIVAALGLRGAQPRRAEQQQPAEVVTPAVEAAPTEAAEATEAEESVEQPEEGHAAGDGQAGTRRRRRRRRSSPHVAHDVEDGDEQQAGEASEALAEITPPTPTVEERATRNGVERYGDFGPFEQPYAPYTPGTPYTGYGSRSTREQPAEQQPWEISAAQEQMRQSESPFGAPEPSFARGFGPQPRGVAGPAREFYPRTGRTERLDTPPMSSNQLGAVVTQAIQQQTDRLLAELRHQQTPPSMTVMFPPFPSTERVGVFVDVANLLYSSRSMRISLDFGRLLDFLRGNRRLTRAHAYAPTNPDPNAEQAFLSVVKGLGYRITTKNYKTFSSGAKKADLDLDMCMDIVRLVDSGAVETVVLVSGDSDFLPLLEYCSDKGVRVEVAAFDDSAAMILRQSCDLFINLSLVDDIRA